MMYREKVKGVRGTLGVENKCGKVSSVRGCYKGGAAGRRKSERVRYYHYSEQWGGALKVNEKKVGPKVRVKRG